MKYWARKVEQLAIHCSECQRIAQRVLHGEPLLYGQKNHLEHDVRAALDEFNRRLRDGIEADYARRGNKPERAVTEEKGHGSRE
ncbi:MAG: hypothetical protein AB7P69_03135 [Candidatus Binatia bacterium]